MMRSSRAHSLSLDTEKESHDVESSASDLRTTKGAHNIVPGTRFLLLALGFLIIFLGICMGHRLQYPTALVETFLQTRRVDGLTISDISNDRLQLKYDTSLPSLRDPTDSYGLFIRADPKSPEDLFKECVCKGDKFIKMMKLKDDKAEQLMPKPMISMQSEFLDYDDLKKWGWDWIPFDSWDFESYDIVDAIKGLGLDPKKTDDGGHFFGQHFEHDLGEVEVDGKRYPSTHGIYITLFDKEDGLILGLSKYSPAYMGPKQDPPVHDLPKLQRWSDIVFLQWKQLMEDNDLGSIKYMMSWPVDNTACQTVLREVFRRSGKTLAPWPGETFGIDSDEGKSLLGCPNGVGIGWFLVQHKTHLGNKIVEKITVFQDNTNKKKPGFIYYIKDQPARDD